ncbi:hypothetical protein [Methanococcus maripaludis]|uniref:Uncharacterized protein n=2 Tax=Methanococcus maripaludis TaxID=39152 RepID=A0A7J9PIH6_METMI|nr:hypothetical protein [Methanococcus maripaludis]MBA2862921.1 hypothetical protein [Methanococcus maripaludis]
MQLSCFDWKMGYNMVKGVKKPRLQLPQSYNHWIGEYVYISSTGNKIILSKYKSTEKEIKRKISYFSNAEVKRPVIVIPDEYIDWVDCSIDLKIHPLGIIELTKK